MRRKKLKTSQRLFLYSNNDCKMCTLYDNINSQINIKPKRNLYTDRST